MLWHLLVLGIILQVHLLEGRLDSVCTLPMLVGSCKAYFPRYYFNLVTGQCEQFGFGGCDGNANNFLTEGECVKTCECSLDVDPGTGDQQLARWYFKRRNCRPFTYTGSGGNANNFHTKHECELACK